MRTSFSAGENVEPTAQIELFQYLNGYREGSGRAGLLPLDEAVSKAATDESLRSELEGRLISILAGGCSPEAREYICSKLALIGSDRCTGELGKLLGDPTNSTAARTALEAIPGRNASKLLRSSVAKLEGVYKAGALRSLGVRRDQGSIPKLARSVMDPDPNIARAATGALGQIGTAEAARALAKCYRQADESLRSWLADPMLTCASRLAEEGDRRSATELCELLREYPSEYMRRAAQRCLEQKRS